MVASISFAMIAAYLALFLAWFLVALARKPAELAKQPAGGAILLLGPPNTSAEEIAGFVRELKERGYAEVRVSAEPHKNSLAEAVRLDIHMLMLSRVVAVMPLWHRWPRPRLIVAAARSLGLPVLDITTMRQCSGWLRIVHDDDRCRCSMPSVIRRVGEHFGRDCANLLRSRN